MARIKVKHGPLVNVENYPGLNGELIWAEDAGKLFITDISGNKRLIGGGGGIIVQTVEERDSIPVFMRQWRMIVGVFNDANPFRNGQYEMVYNLEDTDISNNANFRSLNKHIIHLVDCNEGVVSGGAHQLSNGVVPVMYALDNASGRFLKVTVEYEINPGNGDLHWKTINQVGEGYLVLI